MKTNLNELPDDHNLVMFPSAKNFKVDLRGVELGRDPLHELLNEFSHITEKNLPLHHDERFEHDSEMDLNLGFEDELDGDSFHSLEAFMTRHQRSETLSPDDKLAKLINDRIDAIKEAKERIKFYLEEIEMFLPSRRK